MLAPRATLRERKARVERRSKSRDKDARDRRRDGSSRSFLTFVKILHFITANIFHSDQCMIEPWRAPKGWG